MNCHSHDDYEKWGENAIEAEKLFDENEENPCRDCKGGPQCVYCVNY